MDAEQTVKDAQIAREGGWRPIESAPKDDGVRDEWDDTIRGPKILVWLPDYSIPWVAWWKKPEHDEGFWESYYSECMGSEAYAELKPTHWQPLPPPPTAHGD